MESCPGCEREVEEVHPLPPEVITKELIAILEGSGSPAELDTCVDCLDELMRADTIS